MVIVGGAGLRDAEEQFYQIGEKDPPLGVVPAKDLHLIVLQKDHLLGGQGGDESLFGIVGMGDDGKEVIDKIVETGY